MVSDVHFPTGSLALMIKRGEETLIPKGDTMIMPGDHLIISVPAYESQSEDISLREMDIDADHPWCHKTIEALNLPDTLLIVLIKRKDENIIPFGKTRLLPGDTVVYAVSG